MVEHDVHDNGQWRIANGEMARTNRLENYSQFTIRNSLFLGALQYQSYRSVVDGPNVHLGLKSACGHFKTEVFDFLHKIEIELLCLFGWRGLAKGGSPPSGAVAVKGELGDDQNFPVHVFERAVHLSRLIFKDSELGHLFYQLISVSFGVFFGDAEEETKSRSGFPYRLSFNRYPAFSNPLQENFHLKVY